MSLTLPAVYSAAIARPAMQENWLFQLYDNSSNFIGLSFADTTVGGVFYYGAILNRPQIRESINLYDSTSKTGNIQLEVANFKYGGDDFSAELFGGSNKYINWGVKIYSQLDGNTTLANCLQIYEGRTISIQHTPERITIEIEEQRPWDFITIPNVKNSFNNDWVPVSYGEFKNSGDLGFGWRKSDSLAAEAIDINETAIDVDSGLDFAGVNWILIDSEVMFVYSIASNTLTVARGVWNTSNATHDDDSIIYVKTAVSLRPVPFIWSKYDDRYYMTGDFDPDTADAHIYLKNVGAFPVFDDTDSAAVNEYNGYTSRAGTAGDRIARFYPTEVREAPESPATDTDWSDPGLAITLDEQYASIGYIADGGSNDPMYFNIPALDFESITHVKCGVIWEMTGGGGDSNGRIRINVGFESEATTEVVVVAPGSVGAINVNEVIGTITKDANSYPEYIQVNTTTASIATGTIWIYGVWLEVSYTPTREEFLKSDTAYIGGDGYPQGYTGGSGTASDVHEVHRDLLDRFAGFDATPWADGGAGLLYGWHDNYSSGDNDGIDESGDRLNWFVKWWQKEPRWLADILEQLQFEGCFIFKFRPGGGGRYIHILDAYAAGDVAATLGSNDILGVSIGHTSFRDLITKMIINYDRHPAEDRYISSVTTTDTTNNPRTAYNIQTVENVREINLDFLTIKAGDSNPGDNSPNDNFAAYYNFIWGNPKLIVSCDIVNPANSYGLETGDIIQFSDMPIDPFGDSWSGKYFMITEMKRSVGKIAISAYEVG